MYTEVLRPLLAPTHPQQKDKDMLDRLCERVGHSKFGTLKRSKSVSCSLPVKAQQVVYLGSGGLCSRNHGIMHAFMDSRIMLANPLAHGAAGIHIHFVVLMYVWSLKVRKIVLFSCLQVAISTTKCYMSIPILYQGVPVFFFFFFFYY